MFFSADFRLPLCHALLSENEHTVSDVLISSGIPLSVYATILMTLPPGGLVGFSEELYNDSTIKREIEI